MHTSKKIKTRYKYTVQYTSIKQNKCVPKKLKFRLVWNYTKNRKHKEKTISSEKYHLVVSLHISWRKLMDKRTCVAKATAKQGGIERNNVDMVQIQSLSEICAIRKLLRSHSSAQDLALRRA